MVACGVVCIVLVINDVECGSNCRLLRSELVGIDQLTWLLMDDCS